MHQPTAAGLPGSALPTRHLATCLAQLRALAVVLLLAAATSLLFAVTAPQGLRGALGAMPLEPMGQRGGLFFRSQDEAGETAGYEAPLLHSEVRIAVHGAIARTTVRQHFLNPSDRWLKGVYVFPLPEDSAVDRLTLVIGERRITGRILEKEEARRTYQEAAAEGRRASLLSAERPNVFTAAVANVAPGDAVTVEIEYQERLDYADGRYELRFPMTVAPRYTPPAAVSAEAPGPADPPTIDPAAIDPAAAAPQPGDGGEAVGRDIFGPIADPDDGTGPGVSLLVELDAGLPLAHLESLSHDVVVEADGPTRRLVRLTETRVPADRDFVLTWMPETGAVPAAAVFAEEVAGDSYLLIDLLPPATAAPTAAPPRDLVFIVDTSGSMHGQSLAQARQALLLALDRLRPEDRFNLIRFDDETFTLFQRSLPATPGNLAQARRYARALQAEGGTEMLPALARALAEPAQPGHLRQVVFLTDGAVSNEEELFALLHRRLGDSRLFTVAIGAAPNAWLMTRAAELGRGSHTFIGDIGEVSERMSALLRHLEQPAVTDLAAAWPTALQLVDQRPGRIADVYTGRPVTLAVRLPGVALADLDGAVTLRGRLPDGSPWQGRAELAGLQPVEGVSALWARKAIAELEADPARGEDRALVRAEMTRLAMRHALVTRWTSLVAVEEDRIARPDDAPLQRGEIGRQLPDGWDAGQVFGGQHPTSATGAAPPSPRGAALGTALATPRPTAAQPMRPVTSPLVQSFLAQPSVALPQTATPATLQALLGLALAAGGLLLWLVLRHGRVTAAARPGGRGAATADRAAVSDRR